MKTAIVTGDYHVPGETFINRHIADLFGGETCVVTGRYGGHDPIGREIFVRRDPLSLADKVRAPGAMLLNRMRHGTARAPFGRRRSELISFLRDQQVKVVLAEFGTQALALAPLANDIDIPIFTYFRGTDASKHVRRARIAAAYAQMMPRLTGVFSVSQFLLDNLVRHGVPPHPNAHVVPSGVDIRRFTPEPKKSETFLAVGRFIEKKAPDVTLKAFAQAVRGFPAARLEFIGDGPLLAHCRALAEDLDVAGQVVFHGAKPHDVVRAKLQQAEFFLQHSVTARDGNTEGLPTAIQEALACGCITITTRHAGIPEAVEDGVNGYLVDEHDEIGFSDAIRDALQQRNRGDLSAVARATAEAKFDNDKGLARVEQVLRDAVRR
ncbi:glycosyltransferase [Actibacterium sp. 188UL27-1]|uniref:glycosyltransferase n=1 Tax=Actibacterium sp. 188UL27-1 TaxID=2786961 RepID=UPI0019594ACC|nr:glycosyltransferase [Actibacterium sp. 188UL27-1]